MTMEPTDGFNPYAPPESPLEEMESLHEALRPVPWEDLEAFPGFWQRVGGMFSLLFANPFELVDRIPRTEGAGPAWRFSMLMALPYLGFMGLMFTFMGSIFAFTPPDPTMPKGFLVGVITGELLLILAMLALGMFVAGAILHASLWMWGGTREGAGLVQTIRLCGYAWGFVHLGMVVPCVNFFVGLAGLIYIGMGLARIHRTDTWRGVCAAFTPLLLCCCSYALILLAAMGLSALRPHP